MNEGVKEQAIAQPEIETQAQKESSDKELNFRRLEAAREAEKEARIRAEMEAQHLRKDLEEIKQMLQPKEADPLEGVEDYVDPARLRATLAKERSTYERKAEEIARKTFEKLENQRAEQEKGRFLERLKRELPDYDQVMNESNIAQLEKIDPVFLETVLAVPDDYARRQMTYKKIKSLPKAEAKPSIQEKVVENQQNPYYIPSGSGTPSGLPNAIDFDVSSKDARMKAYQKLKQAQKRSVGPSQNRA